MLPKPVGTESFGALEGLTASVFGSHLASVLKTYKPHEHSHRGLSTRQDASFQEVYPSREVKNIMNMTISRTDLIYNRI